EQNRRGEQRGSDRTANERRGDVHRASLCCAIAGGRDVGCASTTFAPGLTLYWPSTTTRTPAASPSSMIALPSWVTGTWMGFTATESSAFTTYARSPFGPRCTTDSGTVITSRRVPSMSCAFTYCPGHNACCALANVAFN